MKVVILAGGFGTRISEETHLIPKPMIRIGDMPIIWHIMKHFYFYGHKDFYICLGYKSDVIKSFFYDYKKIINDFKMDYDESKEITYLSDRTETWKINLIYTGVNTQTGGRILKLKKYLDNEDFMLTYGDGVSNVNLKNLYQFHKSEKSICTVTAVRPPGRFGSLEIGINNKVKHFIEKPSGDKGWINGGFFVCKPEIFKFINDENTVFESEPLVNLAKQDQLSAFYHDGFWQPMDSMRDKNTLEEMWGSDGKYAPWKSW